jgi:hypothetical protein
MHAEWLLLFLVSLFPTQNLLVLDWSTFSLGLNLSSFTFTHNTIQTLLDLPLEIRSFFFSSCFLARIEVGWKWCFLLKRWMLDVLVREARDEMEVWVKLVFSFIEIHTDEWRTSRKISFILEQVLLFILNLWFYCIIEFLMSL